MKIFKYEILVSRGIFEEMGSITCMKNRKSFFYIKYVILWGILLYAGCSIRPDQVNKNSATQEDINQIVKPFLKGPPEIRTYRLWHTIDQFDLNKFQFFGEFYDERLKFYYSEDPQLQIGDAKVNLIILYFLDDRLVKVRYHLDRNIEEHLMDSLGIGLLDTKYNRNKQVLATERSLRKLKEFNLSRNDPNEYEICWDRSIITSSFLVNAYSGIKFEFDTISARYIYIDQLKSYKKRLIEIENSQIARLKGDRI